MVGTVGSMLQALVAPKIMLLVLLFLQLLSRHGLGNGGDNVFIKARSNGCCRLLDDTADFFTRIRIIDRDGGKGHGATHVTARGVASGCWIKVLVEVLEVV